MILKKMLKLDNMAMPQILMDHDLRLQLLLSLALCQSLLFNDLSSISLSRFLRDEFKTLRKSSLNVIPSTLPRTRPFWYRFTWPFYRCSMIISCSFSFYCYFLNILLTIIIIIWWYETFIAINIYASLPSPWPCCLWSLCSRRGPSVSASTRCNLALLRIQGCGCIRSIC